MNDLTDDRGRPLGPYPRGWSDSLGRLLQSASTHDAMARKWYADRGKAYPGDPGEKFTRIAEAGARGEDVREMVEREVVG